MKIPSLTLITLGLAIVPWASPLLAQNAGTGGLQSADQVAAEATSDQPAPVLKESPTKAMQDFEPPENAEYELGAGDSISLDFPGHPEMNTKRIVGPDGRITIPLAGAISVDNKTRQQASKSIEDALAPYYKDLTVTVDVEKYGSNRIIVLGNVQHPGVLYFDSTPTLLDVIARGGLMSKPTSTIPNPGSTQDGIPDRCAIYRGNDKVMWVDLKQLLKGGSALADLRLKRNDVVFIPSQQELFVSVLGAVKNPGAVPISSESTLASILARAGGPAEGAAQKIQIVQPSTGKTVTVAFKDAVSLKGLDEVKLKAGDVIYVPQSGFYKSTYVLQRLSPVTSLGMIAAYAAGTP
jgi:polysaccharide export outer membrane protein